MKIQVGNTLQRIVSLLGVCPHLWVRGRDPLVDGDSVGVQIPLEHDPVPLPRLQGVGAVQHHVIHCPVLNDSWHIQPVQLSRANSCKRDENISVCMCPVQKNLSFIFVGHKVIFWDLEEKN